MSGQAACRRAAQPSAGRERLVEVQHVEVVGLEQDVDVGDEVDRRRDHGARAGERRTRRCARRRSTAGEGSSASKTVSRSPSSTAWTLAPGLAHRLPVGARRDDRHAVTTGGEASGQRRHLVVDAARLRPGVRGEESDAVAHGAMVSAPAATRPPAEAGRKGTGRGLSAPARPGTRSLRPRHERCAHGAPLARRCGD